ncbi:N-acetylneuraminic acid mutarotase, partial [Salmonella enterica subsp. enterica serovar Heidelberg str. 77-1831]
TGGVNEHIFDKYFIDIAAADESEKIKSSIIILINLPKIIF